MTKYDKSLRVPGVYAVVFLTDHGDEIYIGASRNSISCRISSHISCCKRGKHRNHRFQNLWDKYQKFEVRILKVCGRNDNIIREEQLFIDSIDSEIRINMGPVFVNPMLGKHHSKKTRQKISEGNQGKQVSDETCHKISKAKLGKPIKPCSEDRRQKISNALRGKPKSADWRHKLSEAKRGKKGHPQSEETRRKISEGKLGRNLGKHPSEETRRKLADAQRGKPAPNRGKSPTMESRRKMSDAQKRRWNQKKGI